MDLELIVPVGHPVYPDRIVEVASRLAVDGDDVESAIVVPPGNLGSRYRVWKIVRLPQDVVRELVRDMKLADDDFDVDAEIVGGPEHLDHLADGVFAVFGELENLDVDDHPVEVFD